MLHLVDLRVILFMDEVRVASKLVVLRAMVEF